MQLEHPETERLSAYLDHDLPDREQAEVASHVEGCARCRSEIESLQSMLSAFRALPELEAPPGFSSRVLARIEAEEQRGFWALVRRWRVATWLAPMAAVVLVFVMVRRPERDELRVPAVEFAEGVRGPAPAESAAAPAKQEEAGPVVEPGAAANADVAPSDDETGSSNPVGGVLGGVLGGAPVTTGIENQPVSQKRSVAPAPEAAADDALKKLEARGDRLETDEVGGLMGGREAKKDGAASLAMRGEGSGGGGAAGWGAGGLGASGGLAGAGRAGGLGKAGTLTHGSSQGSTGGANFDQKEGAALRADKAPEDQRKAAAEPATATGYGSASLNGRASRSVERIVLEPSARDADAPGNKGAPASTDLAKLKQAAPGSPAAGPASTTKAPAPAAPPPASQPAPKPAPMGTTVAPGPSAGAATPAQSPGTAASAAPKESAATAQTAKAASAAQTARNEASGQPAAGAWPSTPGAYAPAPGAAAPPRPSTAPTTGAAASARPPSAPAPGAAAPDARPEPARTQTASSRRGADDDTANRPAEKKAPAETAAAATEERSSREWPRRKTAKSPAKSAPAPAAEAESAPDESDRSKLTESGSTTVRKPAGDSAATPKPVEDRAGAGSTGAGASASGGATGEKAGAKKEQARTNTDRDAKNEPPDAIITLVDRPNLIDEVRRATTQLKGVCLDPVKLEGGRTRLRLILPAGAYPKLIDALRRTGALGSTPPPAPAKEVQRVWVELQPS